jgi:hypothetical protein
MKTHVLPPLTKGLDVLSPETDMPEGTVRVASNIAIINDGSYQRRPGYVLLSALSGAHSFWRSDATTRALVAAENVLYDVDLSTGGLSGLCNVPYEQPVEYTDVAADIYFTAGGMLGKIDPYGNVRTPGVANLLSDSPTLTATVGDLMPGRYGLAYSLVNDLGEESPISGIAWIDMPGGGILVSGIQNAADVVSMNIYRTEPNGGELYRAATRPYSATASITDGKLGRHASRQYRQPMPGGSIVREYKGRLYVADGATLWISDPLDYGINHVKSGWKTFGRTITMVQPVASGVFIGLRERTIFLRGNGPEDFEQVDVARHGAHTGATVPATFFSEELAPTRDLPVAVWLSDAGMAIGRPEHGVVYPQASQIQISGNGGRVVVAEFGGIKQAIFCVDSMSLGDGGPVDTII